MRNELFEIAFNSETGAVCSVVNPKDKDLMNWCIEDGEWGTLRYNNQSIIDPLYKKEASVERPTLASFCENDDFCRAVYVNESLQFTVERFFADNGNYTERYTVKNLRDSDFFLETGTLGVYLPFNDIYTYADDCMTNRCHTHIWCGGNTAYVNALKMGVSNINLGLVLTEGSTPHYSVKDPKSNHRGRFILNFDHCELLSGEQAVLEYQMFWHRGNKDFYEKAGNFPTFIGISAEEYTVFEDESIAFSLTAQNSDELKITCDGEEVELTKRDGAQYVCYKPKRTGEHKFIITANRLKTYCEFFVAEEIYKLIEKRIDFIVDKQQYKRENSRLSGAFLIYDTKENELIFDEKFHDHNACRERIGMALLIAKYLQSRNNSKFRAALELYTEFVIREAFDPKTGDVFNGIGKSAKFKRLYNAPWLANLFTEMYYLTDEKTYLSYIVKLLENYYSGGGFKFYPNGFNIRRSLEAFRKAGLESDFERIKELFKKHCDNIMENGLSYPKHEVNFEQTIVSPAATFLSEMAFVLNGEEYKREANKHIEILARFNGHQPSFHLNEIPIRYWDNFWFGKGRLFGDTFPHYWSCLTARSFGAFYLISGDEEIRKAARQCMRNCLCLFGDKGEGYSSYVYPFRINDVKGAFYDEWANDQDFALYFYLILKDYYNIL